MPVSFDDSFAFMKIVAAVVVTVVGMIVAATLLLPTDVVENRYSSLAEARIDHLFDRGWLPDILPASAYDIRTNNNLDLNLSEGQFSFEPLEAAAFMSRVQPSGLRQTSSRALNDGWQRCVARALNPTVLLMKTLLGCFSARPRLVTVNTQCGFMSANNALRQDAHGVAKRSAARAAERGMLAKG